MTPLGIWVNGTVPVIWLAGRVPDSVPAAVANMA